MYIFKTVLITKWEDAVNLDNRRQYNGRVLSTKTTRNSKIWKVNLDKSQTGEWEITVKTTDHRQCSGLWLSNQTNQTLAKSCQLRQPQTAQWKSAVNLNIHRQNN